jgi:hypothetical protein
MWTEVAVERRRAQLAPSYPDRWEHANRGQKAKTLLAPFVLAKLSSFSSVINRMASQPSGDREALMGHEPNRKAYACLSFLKFTLKAQL